MDKRQLDKDSKVLIASFSLWEKGKRSHINGNIKPLLSFFTPRVDQVDLIDGLHPGSDQTATIIETYRRGRKTKISQVQISKLLSPILNLTNINKTQISFKIRDFLSVLEWVIKSKEKYDLFIGLESIYTLAAILLKKTGRIRTVVYYVSDYSPNRYSQKWFNNLYLWLDRFSATNADFIWDVSSAMQPARIKAGLDPKKSAPNIHVPNARFPEMIKYLPFKDTQPFSLVYAGGFGKINGPGLAIEAMPWVIKKIPQSQLYFYGWPKDKEDQLKKLAKKLKVTENCSFHGFVSSESRLTKALQKYRLGLAPYRAIPNSIRWYADAIKIRHYLSCGLPVVTTQVPPLGKEIEKAGAGLVTQDKPKEFAQAIIKLLGNQNRYQETRRAAIAYIKDNTWENSFSQALKKMKLL